MSGVSVAKKNGGLTSAIFANDTRWRPNSQILHRRDRSNSRVTETARPSGVLTMCGLYCVVFSCIHLDYVREKNEGKNPGIFLKLLWGKCVWVNIKL